MAIEFVGSSYSTDNHDIGSGDVQLYIPAPVGLQEGDFCVACAIQDSGATGSGTDAVADLHPRVADDSTAEASFTFVQTIQGLFYGQNSGGNAIPQVWASAGTVGATPPDHWRLNHRDGSITTDRNLIGFVMAFRNFVVDPADCGWDGSVGTVVGPASADATPTTDVRVWDDDADAHVIVTAYWCTWSGTDTIATVGTPTAVDTFDDEIGAVILAPVVVRRSIAGAYNMFAEGSTPPADDQLTWTRTDQTSVRGRAISFAFQGVSVESEIPAVAGRLELPRTRLNLKNLPHHLNTGMLDGARFDG